MLFDYPRPQTQSYKGSSLFFELDRDLKEKLNTVCTANGITTYQFLLSCYFLLLYEYSMDKDICIGTPHANRNYKEIEKLIGLFINVTVIRGQVDTSLPFIEFAKRISAKCIEAERNSQLPFENVLDELNVPRVATLSPLFQVMYVQMEGDYIQRNVQIPGISVEPVPVKIQTSQYDLSLYVTVNKENISAYFEYNSDLFEKTTVQDMADDFQRIVKLASTKIERTVDELTSDLKQRCCKINIISGFEASMIKESLEFWSEKLALPVIIIMAPYGQVIRNMIELSDKEKKTRDYDINLFLIRFEDWMQGMDPDAAVTRTMISENVGQFIAQLKRLKRNHSIVYICPMSDEIKQHKEMYEHLCELEKLMIKECSRLDFADIRLGERVCMQRELNDYQDYRGANEWHIPYAREFFAVLGTDFVEKLIQ